MRSHAGYGQPPLGTLAGALVVATAPIWIGHDGLAANLVEGDVLGRVVAGGGNRDGSKDALGV